MSSAGHDPRWKLTPTKYVVAGLLLVGIVVPLLVCTYDQIEPRLFGFPFFYWYQLLWVFLAAGLLRAGFCCSSASRTPTGVGTDTRDSTVSG